MLKSVVQTAKREWKNLLSGTPGLVRQVRTVSGERERTGPIKSWRSRQTEVGINSGTDAEAEIIWQNTTEEEDDNNRSIVTIAASHHRSKEWKQEVEQEVH